MIVQYRRGLKKTGNTGAKRKGTAVLTSRSASSSSPRTTVPQVSLKDLRVAKNAFYLKYYIRMPKKTSKRRRTLQEPLTNYQKRTLVDRYIAARGEDVDYKHLSAKTAIEVFIGHPKELKKHGDRLLQEFYELYEEDQAQIDELEAITSSSPVAPAATEPSTGDESLDEHEVATHSPEKVNLKVAVVLQKVKMAEALLKEVQDTLNHLED